MSEDTFQHSGWTFSSAENVISGARSIAEAGTRLGADFIPEMVYFENFLKLTHHASGFCLEFNAEDALTSVPLTHKQCDWTFTSEYQGTLTGDRMTVNSDCELDLDMLKRRDPILFFKNIILYEDELHDHGLCSMTVKIRVMQKCFLVLLRFWLRIDKERIRLYETRVFHVFGTENVLSEFSHRESTFEELEKKGFSKNPADYSSADVCKEKIELKSAKKRLILLSNE